MKHTLFILALFTATIQTFAQSPRIKLNQITKDSLTGSVLISSPTDSGMVYSRDLFVSYGADTFLILGGDTLAATSSIISSVLSDGVTITGNGTTGSELTVDTTTVIATKQDLDLYYLDSNPDGYTSNTGTVTSVGGTGTVNGISLSGTVTSSGDLTLGGTLSNVNLASQVTGTLPIANGGTGATTLAGAGIVTGSGTNNYIPKFTGSTTVGNSQIYDNGTQVGIGTTSPAYKLDVDVSTDADWAARVKNTSSTGYGLYVEGSENNSQYILGLNNGLAYQMVVTGDGNVGIGTTSPSEVLDVNGNAIFRSIGSGASAGALHYTSTGVLTTNTSDVRLKTNINPLENTLEKLLNVNTYTFNWINESDRVDLGMIAQEVEEIFPRLVFTNSVDGYKGIHYDKFSSILTKAIQEQQAIIESQATEIKTLKSQIQLILNEIEQLKNN